MATSFSRPRNRPKRFPRAGQPLGASRRRTIGRPDSRPLLGSTPTTEKRGQVVGEQQRLFQGSEVAARGSSVKRSTVKKRSANSRGGRPMSLGNRAKAVGTASGRPGRGPFGGVRPVGLGRV